MISKHTALSLLTSVLLSLGAASPVAAQSYCEGPTPTDLTINKDVRNPITGLFVDNLNVTDATYSLGSEVLFRLTIKNASGETFNPVTVKDVFPDQLTFVSGPGTYDTKNRALTFELENLVAGESRTVEILAKFATNGIPNGTCVNNTAYVSAPARPSGDNDTAQVCVQTEVLGATTLPVAGFSDILAVLPFIALGFGGITLLKKRG